MTEITEPCWVADMPEVEYHADPCPHRSLSSTMARTLLMPGGPARLHAGLTFSPQTKRAFDVGHAAHEKILGRGQGAVSIPEEHLTPSGNVSTKKDTVAWLEEQRAAGMVPLTAADVVMVDDMAEALLAHPIAAELLTRGRGQPELSLFDTDKRTGRWMRGRIDFLADRLSVCDYKTTGKTVDEDSWGRVSWNLGYHIQAAQYVRLAVALGVIEPDADFYAIAQEKTPPYLVSVNRFDDELLAAGHAAVAKAVTIWDRCLALGDWPGLPHTIQTISAPRWAQIDDDEDEETF